MQSSINIIDFLNAPVTYVTGAKNPNPTGFGSVSDVLEMIQDQAALHQSNELFSLFKRDKEQYTRQKESLHGFIIGSFSKRTDANCTDYVPLLCIEIDKVKDEFMTQLIIQECKNVPYILAAFASPSRHGLRMLVPTASNLENHKSFYTSLCEYLSYRLNIPTATKARELNLDLKTTMHLDTACSNVSRLWFIASVPSDYYYFNKEAIIYEMVTTQAPVFAENPNAPSVMQRESPRYIAITEDFKIALCKEQSEKNKNITSRNNKIYYLACLLIEHGVSDQAIYNTCLTYAEKDFNESEINKTVQSALKTTKLKYSDAQIATYVKKNQTTPSLAPVPQQIPPLQSVIHEVIEETATSFIEGDDDDKDKEVIKNSFIEMRDYLLKRYDFRLNIVSLELEVKRAKKAGGWELLNENDLMIKLYEYGFKKIDSMLNVFLSAQKYVTRYDPFKDYFERLTPYSESEPDYILQLCSYIESDDKEFFLSMFRKHLVRTAACALNIIKFNKQCFTIHGEQNDGKTSFVRYLVPAALDNYKKENPDLSNKDGKLTLAQNFIINLDELASMSKYEINQMKATFTYEDVKERLPYDKKPSTMKRRASFFGSTNKDEFLTDPTGNIRWLVFEVKKIVHDNGGPNGYQAVAIDNVWRQVYYLLKTGFKFNLTAEDTIKINERNQFYMKANIETELLQRIIKRVSDDIGNLPYFVNSSDLSHLLETLTSQRLDIGRIGEAMRGLGYIPKSFRPIGSPIPVKKYTVYFTTEKYEKLYQEKCDANAMKPTDAPQEDLPF
jgi:hypothetical protein